MSEARTRGRSCEDLSADLRTGVPVSVVSRGFNSQSAMAEKPSLRGFNSRAVSPSSESKASERQWSVAGPLNEAKVSDRRWSVE
jgi:hypothetical protein